MHTAQRSLRRGYRVLRTLALIGLTTIIATHSSADVFDLDLVEVLHEAQAEHVDQRDLYDLVSAGEEEQAFLSAFDLGDELFEVAFNALDGVGANVGEGQRFSRVPRADLNGADQWASHFPQRATGPNAESCVSCHNTPEDDGAGVAASNVVRDPLHSGSPGSFILRNTPHVFAPGALQRLAEEMNEELEAIRDVAIDTACATGENQVVEMITKGIDYGVLEIQVLNPAPCETALDSRDLRGVSADLIVRPFQWKGNFASIRDFNRDAAHNELGMQSVEIVGYGVDGDSDNVFDEMTVGDQTALAIYLAAQPRPVSKIELNRVGLLDLSDEEIVAIKDGEKTFRSTACATCHRSKLLLDDPIFREPSANANYRDAVFPSGLDPIAEALDPAFSVSFDLTLDQPDNQIVRSDGTIGRLGAFRTDAQGRAVVYLYGDLKHHDMGPGLAENIDETGTGNSTWLTKELWGVGSTAPYLHDGRASTLTEAILEHGGEADESRRLFEALALDDQQNLIAFLDNLVLFKLSEE